MEVKMVNGQTIQAAKISPPGLRNRILTDVHYNNYHWIFDKTATHYKT